MIANVENAWLTSVNAECLFCVYKNILSDQRTRMTLGIKKYTTVNFLTKKINICNVILMKLNDFLSNGSH